MEAKYLQWLVDLKKNNNHNLTLGLEVTTSPGVVVLSVVVVLNAGGLW